MEKNQNEENVKNPVGRPKNIKTPELMWKHFEDYWKETKSKPKLVHDFVGKIGKSVYRERERPLTMDGFELWLQDNEIISDPTDYFENKDGRYSEYVRVCSRIKKAIRRDQIEGGLAGIYNPSITQRLNGLAEKSEVAVKAEQPIFGD